MQKIKKINLIFVIIILLSFCGLIFNSITLADDSSRSETASGHIITSTDSYKPNSDDSNSTLTSVTGTILGAIRVFGTIVSVGVLIVIGIKYMLASPEGKADYKQAIIPYIIGAVLLFATTNVVQILYEVMN